MDKAPERIWSDGITPTGPGAVEYVRADLYEQVKRELEMCQHDNAAYKSTVDHLKQRAEAAERLAGARVKVPELRLPNGEIYELTMEQGRRAIAAALSKPNELAEIEELLATGQGDDDGPQILPDFEPGISTLAKVEACLHLLERRRDVLSALAEPVGEAEPVAWLRDIDGTGSLHPASKGDPGAFPVYTTPPDANATDLA